MLVKVLGTAAGGGLPQWNCACANCAASRALPARIKPRLHASLAVSSSGDDWYLINATPDVRFQIESFSHLHAGPAVRNTPIKGIILSDAELDHTIGLLILREGASLDVFGTRPVLAALAHEFPVKSILSGFAGMRFTEVVPGEEFLLDGGRLAVLPVQTGQKAPRYVRSTGGGDAWVVSYRLRDLETGQSLFYAPCLESRLPEIADQISQCQVSFVDGTFWSEDEMQQLGACQLGASQMGHVPLSGAEGLAKWLSGCGLGRKILIHVNNTNPILLDNSPQATTLFAMGIELGSDGMEIEL